MSLERNSDASSNGLLRVQRLVLRHARRNRSRTGVKKLQADSHSGMFERFVECREWKAATKRQLQVRRIVRGEVLCTSEVYHIAENPTATMLIDCDREG